MIFVNINNKIFFVKKNISILEACKFVGIIIPRFCYHESLSVAGNCRMCLVEIEPNVNLKPVSACTLNITEEVHILTDTPFVKKARENILETLLISHPLDCPICDQGGECDLQDQTKIYGIKTARYSFIKRSVEDKFLGSLVKTIMTRCIHCTRCVRFSDEFIGKKHLGTLNRGQNTEIGTFVNSIFDSNISGNVIDLCPVGALTSKTYAFKARPWELKTSETIDLTDSTGSNIYVSVKESEIIRILPKKDLSLSTAFISDKTRFSFDATKNSRLLQNFIKKTSWEAVNWAFMLGLITDQLNKKSLLFMLPEELDFQLLTKFRSLQNSKGTALTICNVESSSLKSNFYKHSSSTACFEYQNCFIISSNIQLENVILNIKLRMLYLKQEINIFAAGFCFSTNFPVFFITFSLFSLLNLFQAKIFSSFNAFFNFLFIFGVSLNNRISSDFLGQFINKFFATSFVFKLTKACNSKAFSFFNFPVVNTNVLKKASSFFNFKLDETLFLNRIFFFFKKDLNFWFHSHGPSYLKFITCLIPILTAFEEGGLFINFEGRAQKAYRTIVNQNQDCLNLHFFISFFNNNFALNTSAPAFKFFSELCGQINYSDNLEFSQSSSTYKAITFFYKYPFKPSFEDFYQTNGFTRNSLNMFKRSKEIRLSSTNFFK